MSRFAAWSNGPRVAGWFFSVAAVVCGLFAVATYGSAVRLRDDGVRAVAEVVRVDDGGRASDRRVVLRFATRNGREVEATVGRYSWDPPPRAGDRQEVVYDPDDPARSVADARLGPDLVAPGCWRPASRSRRCWHGRRSAGGSTGGSGAGRAPTHARSAHL